MEQFLGMLNAQLVLFVYIAVGMLCKKLGIIDEIAKKKMTDFILKITLPCMIFNSFNQTLTPEILRKTGLALLVSTCIAVMSYVIGKFAYNRFPEEQKHIMQYCTLVNNSGFLGLPLVSAVFGTEGLLYASIFILPNRVMMWTAGLSIFTESEAKRKRAANQGGSASALDPAEEKLRQKKEHRKNLIHNVVLNPALVAVYLGLIRRLFDLPFPAFMDSAISKIGAITSPLSMMIIGGMLIGVRLRDLFDFAALYQSLFRLILLPVIALAIMRLLHFDPVLTGTSLILTGMPAGSTSVLLATQYGGDERFASKLVISSTLLSLITAPLLMLLI
ncbi:MAG: AEC family transporter [Lachnospiraceae bacterium]|nr:AEC family transporter [Lachnospiraceae bacterium]